MPTIPRWPRLLRRPPEDVRATPLPAGERLLAWSSLADDVGRVLATDRALRVMSDPPVVLMWHEIVHAAWESDTSTVVVEASGRDSRVVTHRWALHEPGSVPEVVRERVSASIVIVRHVALSGSRGARIVARRVHGRPDLLWQVHPDAGISLEQRGYREVVQRELVALRSSLG